MRANLRLPLWRQLLHRVVVTLTAPVMTLGCFLVLPLIESIGGSHAPDTIVRVVDEVNVPPPPPPPEPEPEKEPEPEEKPPDLAEEAPPDLSQLELALNPGFEGGFGAMDQTFRLESLTAGAAGEADAMFQEGDLDQKARVVNQVSPVMTAELRRKAPGTVRCLFDVDTNGRVQDARVASSSDPVFERAALAALRQWRFEPGRRNGQAVRSRKSITISFPKN